MREIIAWLSLLTPTKYTECWHHKILWTSSAEEKDRKWNGSLFVKVVEANASFSLDRVITDNEGANVIVRLPASKSLGFFILALQYASVGDQDLTSHALTNLGPNQLEFIKWKNHYANSAFVA